MPILPLIFFSIFSSWSALSTDYNADIARIRESLNDPEAFLKNDGKLIILGNAPLDKARIVFLPEIHDDPKSLMTQLVIIAREQNKGTPFLILDESLGPLKKSMWDVFSQKTMEILAAKDQRRDNRDYVPQQFEQALQQLASKMRGEEGQLNYADDTKLWTLNDFAGMAKPFFGWDSMERQSLVERNSQMVSTLKSALKNNDRILVMAGARHVPELEYQTSKKLICDAKKISSMDSFFASLTKRHGDEPNLQNGIGATTPIHNFLSSQKYAVVFNRAIYSELDKIVAQFKAHLGRKGCMSLTP